MGGIYMTPEELEYMLDNDMEELMEDENEELPFEEEEKEDTFYDDDDIFLYGLEDDLDF